MNARALGGDTAASSAKNVFEFRGNLLRTPRLRGLRATQAIRPF